MTQHYIVIGKVESDTVSFVESIFKVVELAKRNPRAAVIVGIASGFVCATALLAAQHYSSHS